MLMMRDLPSLWKLLPKNAEATDANDAVLARSLEILQQTHWSK